MYDNHDKILIPQVLQQYWETKDNEKVGFSMPYYYASDFIVFLETARIQVSLKPCVFYCNLLKII